MAQAPDQADSRGARVRPSLWRRPLVVGLCFALGYGLTQRLLELGLPSLVQLNQSFEMRPFPGASLESLRQRFGGEARPLRVDLEQVRLDQEARRQEQERLRQVQRQEQELEAERRQADQLVQGEALEAAPQPPASASGPSQPPPPPQLPPPRSNP